MLVIPVFDVKGTYVMGDNGNERTLAKICSFVGTMSCVLVGI